jgi:hypothetical protein
MSGKLSLRILTLMYHKLSDRIHTLIKLKEAHTISSELGLSIGRIQTENHQTNKHCKHLI